MNFKSIFASCFVLFCFASVSQAETIILPAGNVSALTRGNDYYGYTILSVSVDGTEICTKKENQFAHKYPFSDIGKTLVLAKASDSDVELDTDRCTIRRIPVKTTKSLSNNQSNRTSRSAGAR